MNKFSKVLRAFNLLLQKPALLNNVLNDNEVMRRVVQQKHSFGHGLPVIDLLSLFPGFSEEVTPYSFMDGTSTPMDLALLRSLARQHADCRYFEIGTWRGESVANVAAVAKECITLNLPDNEMRKIGLDAKYISQHRFFSSTFPNVQHLQHNSSTFNFNSIGKFDVLFVDGDHHYEQVRMDTQNVFSLLKDESSVIVWHDYKDAGGNVRYEVLAGILDGCPAEFRSKLYHVSNTLCAIFTLKDLSVSPPHVFAVPDKVFSVKISGKKI
jgi:hypothetical protein